ncbi:hypothetical protein ACWOMK_28970 [Bacillus thuringiensis]|uniref:hypothetical protein n=1 Tax=Bacillus tropicus TaxID=2026188 RepID=UPI0035DF75FA
MDNFHCLDIKNFLNNKGSTQNSDFKKGALSMNGSSLPRELLPNNDYFYFNGIPFVFYFENNGDNIEMEGQTLEFADYFVNEAHFIGVSCNGDLMDDIHFLLDDKIVQTSKIYFSDLISEAPAFNDQCALKFPFLNTITGPKKHLKPKLWYCSIKFPKTFKVNGIKFEDNPFMHLFSVTFS